MSAEREESWDQASPAGLDPAKAAEVLAALKAAVASRDGDAAGRLHLARTAAGIVGVCCNEHRAPTAALDHVAALGDLAAAWPDEPSLREAWAWSVGTIIAAWTAPGPTAQDIAAAQTLFDALAGRAAAHPSEPFLRRQWARAAASLAGHHRAADDRDGAFALLESMKAAALERRDEPALRDFWARGMAGLVREENQVSDRKGAHRLVKEATKPLTAATDPALRAWWAWGAMAMIEQLAADSQTEDTRLVLDTLNSLATKHPGEPMLRECWARGVDDMIHVHRHTSDTTKSSGPVFTALTTLAGEHPDEPALREAWAQAAVERIGHLTSHPFYKDKAPRALRDEMASQAARYPGEPILRSLWARGSVALIAYYRYSNDVKRIRFLLDAIETLAGRHPDEPALRHQWAEGAVLLVNAYSDWNSGNNEAYDLSLARSVTGEVQALAARYPDEPALRACLARCLSQEILGMDQGDEDAFGDSSFPADPAKEAANLEEALGLLRLLDSLAANHPDEPALRKTWASAAVSILTRLAKAGDLAGAQVLLDATMPIADVSLSWALAAKSLMAAYCASGVLDRARDVLDTLGTMATRFPHDPDWRERWAEGALVLLTRLDDAGHLEQARALFGAIDELAARHSDERALRYQLWPSAVVTMIGHHGTAGDMKAARILLDALDDRIAGCDPEETHPYCPQQSHDQACVALIAGYCKAGNIAPTAALLDLLRSHADNGLEPYADGLALLADYHAKAGNFAAARGVLERLEEVSDQFLEDDALKAKRARATQALLLDHCAAGDLAGARALLDRMKPLWGLEGLWAETAAAMIPHYGRAGDLASALAVLDELQTVGAEELHGTWIQQYYPEHWANGVIALVTAFGTAAALDGARKHLDTLTVLAAGHPEDPKPGELRGTVAQAMAAAYQAAGDPDRARTVLEDKPSKPRRTKKAKK